MPAILPRSTLRFLHSAAVLALGVREVAEVIGKTSRHTETQSKLMCVSDLFRNLSKTAADRAMIGGGPTVCSIPAQSRARRALRDVVAISFSYHPAYFARRCLGSLSPTLCGQILRKNRTIMTLNEIVEEQNNWLCTELAYIEEEEGKKKR